MFNISNLFKEFVNMFSFFDKDNINETVIVDSAKTNISSHTKNIIRSTTVDPIHKKIIMNNNEDMTQTTYNEYLKKCLLELCELTTIGYMNKNFAFYYVHDTSTLYVEYIGYKNSPFEDGQYIIKFVLPNEFPYKPPQISILTESGRFYPCCSLSLSISHFHPETWYPMSLELLIVNVVSCFDDFTICGIGHVNEPNKEDIKKYALKSREYNKNKHFDIFTEFETLHKLDDAHKLRKMKDRIEQLFSNE